MQVLPGTAPLNNRTKLWMGNPSVVQVKTVTGLNHYHMYISLYYIPSCTYISCWFDSFMAKKWDCLLYSQLYQKSLIGRATADIFRLSRYFYLIYFEWTLKWKYILRLLPPFKIVQLIRDPRGIMASISKGNKLNFKEYRKNILNGKFCEMMINDSNLEQHLPSNR